MEKPIVYYCKEITPENVLKMYKLLNKDLPGKVAVKLHTGEIHNINYIHPEFWKPMIDYVDGTVCECNTAYHNARFTTEGHKKLLDDHGWTKYFKTDIMDSEGEVELVIPEGKVLKKDVVGSHLLNYDSMLVLSHFKGHTQCGYGGALKHLSIGCASSHGKAHIHTAGVTTDQSIYKKHICSRGTFIEAMADASYAVWKHFDNGEKMAYVSVLNNLSIECDCHENAPAPCMNDLGIVASLDPVAIDRACIDIVKNCDDVHKYELLERIYELLGPYVPETCERMGMGKRDYELVEVKF